MGTVIGKLDRRFDSIAVGDTVGIEVDGRTVRYTVDSFGGLVGENKERLSPKEWKGEAFEILEKGERKPEYPDNEPEVIPEMPAMPEPPEASVPDMEDEARRAVDEQAEERLLAMENALGGLRQEMEDLKRALTCFEAAQKSLAGDVDDAVSAVSALRAEAGWLDDAEKGRSLDTFTEEELTSELARRGYRGTVSKIIKMDV